MNRTDVAVGPSPGAEEPRRSVGWHAAPRKTTLLLHVHRLNRGIPTCAGVPTDPNERRNLFPKMKETDHE
jgi:hypothetical protein